MLEDQPLALFALKSEAPPLRLLRDALLKAGHPAGIGVDIAGEATETELDARDWDAAFVRWTQPELHEVYLIERNPRGSDEIADALVAQGLHGIEALSDTAGRLIVSDHLRRTQAVYAIQILPALVADEDHKGWEALDIVLTTLAGQTDGLIYAATEGFYDSDGELLLSERDTPDEEAWEADES